MKLKFNLPLIFFFILVISVFVMIVSSSFFNVLYDDSFYSQSFEKNNVYDVIDVPDMKVMEVIAFLNGENLNLSHSNPPFQDIQFSKQEIEHLEDVRDLILGFRNLYFISFGLFVLLFSAFVFNLVTKYKGTATFKKKFSLFFIKLQISVLSVSSIFIFIFWAIAFFNFTNFFDRFHHIFFEEGTWTFPSNSLSITLFPENFFYDFFIKVLSNIFVFLILLALLLFFVVYLSKMGSRKDSNLSKESHKKN